MNPNDPLSLLVLSVLRTGPAHGYEISHRVRQADSTALKDGEARLYPLLHVLEEDRLLASKWVAQLDKPARRIYTLTHRGSGFLERQSPKQTVDAKTAALLGFEEPHRG
jgi:DNA-binding PadR family transcriptional regulator